MKILITGATGFIAKTLLPLLSEQGHPLVVLTRNLDSAGVRLPVACHPMQWNPDSGPPPAAAFKDVQAVIHLAGEGVATGRWTRKRKQEMRRSRILSTQHLVDAMQSQERKPEVFISASAIVPSPPPPPPRIDAARMIVTPSRSYGSPKIRRTPTASRAWPMISSICMRGSLWSGYD